MRIYFAAEPVDVRKGFDGIRAHVPQGSVRRQLLLFIGKRRDRVYFLFWERSGFVLYLKRLESGRFGWMLDAARSRREAAQHRLIVPAGLIERISTQ